MTVISTSPPGALEINLLSGGKLSILWSTQTGRKYLQQFKNNIEDESWTDSSSFTATGKSSETIQGINTNAHSFFQAHPIALVMFDPK